MCETCCKQCPRKDTGPLTVVYSLHDAYGGYENFTFSDVEVQRLRLGETLTRDGLPYHADDEGNVYETMFGNDLRIGTLPKHI